MSVGMNCSFYDFIVGGIGLDTIDAGEACDGADLGGLDCVGAGGGFTGGTLGCDAACRLWSATSAQIS